jgi:hypothetical protein
MADPHRHRCTHVHALGQDGIQAIRRSAWPAAGEGGLHRRTLATYNAKRNFTGTAEPAGKVARRKAQGQMACCLVGAAREVREKFGTAATPK